MAKRRQIHPEIWTDDKFVSLDPLARLLFIGMWNFACDNGHLDDSNLQLKMRVLPADSCDVAVLLKAIVDNGMVARENGYLKVVNLPSKQALDMRYLVFCDHCDNDPARRYTDDDKVGKKGAPKASPSSTRRAPHGGTSGTPRSGDGDGDGEGEGSKRRKASRPLPSDWQPTPKHVTYADEINVDVHQQAMKFRNDALAKDKRFVDWDAAFRNWLTKALEYGQTRTGSTRPEPKRLPRQKCPTCNAPQEITHYDECPNQKWRPTA